MRCAAVRVALTALLFLCAAGLPVCAQSVDELVKRLAEPESAPGAVFELAAKGKEATGALIKALSSDDAGVRYHALWALTVSDEEIDGSVFAKLLNDKDSLVRLRALFALSVKAPSQTMPILERLASDPDWLVRASAATVLADHRQPAVTEALLKSLEMHRNRFAAVALVSHDGAGAPGLRKLLKCENPVVRRMACFALGRIGDEESLDALNAAAKDKDSNVALSAAVALALMQQDEAYSLLEEALKKRGQSTEEVSAILKKLVRALGALRSTAPGQKAKAYSELGKYGFLPPIPELVEELRKGRSEDTRASAAGALGDIGSDLALSALAQASGDRERAVRLAVAVALGKIAVREAVAPLRELSYDPDPGVRAAAATALAGLDIKDLSPIFKRMSKDPQNRVRMAAFKALDIYPPSFTEPVFISLLKKEKNSESRALLITLLGRIGTENALHVILKETDGPHKASRLAAIEALGNFTDPSAAQKLVFVIKKERTDEEKAAAARALGGTGSELGLPVLKSLFRKARGDVKLAVVEALGNSRSQEAAPPLVLEAVKADEPLACAILCALSKIAQPESLPIIIALARDKDKPLAIRRAAVWALGGFRGQENAKAAAMSFLKKDELAAEAASALAMLGDNSGFAALSRLFNIKPLRENRLRVVRALRLMTSTEATAVLFTAAKDSDTEVALTAALELVSRSKYEGLAILQVILARKDAKEKLREVLKEFELSQVLYPMMEKLVGAREVKTKMAIVEVLGCLEVADFRIPRDASLADYQKLAVRWIRWWEATVAKLPSGAGRIRREEGETEGERKGVMRGLDWLKKKKK